MRRICDAFATQNLAFMLESPYTYPMQKETNLDLILKEGESFFVEFKERIANLDREIVAFANAKGGSIYAGVRDDGHVIGIDITNKLKSEIQDIARNCDPSIKINLQTHAKEKILEIQVAEGADKPYRCKDGFYVRTGPSAQKLRRDEIVYFINKSGKIRFDEAINAKFEFTHDFSKEKLADFLTRCGIQEKLPTEPLLISLAIAEKPEKKLLLNNTGVLFFAKDPQRFFPESYITCVCYQSQDKFTILDKKDCLGNPIEQIEATLQFILRHMSVETRIGELDKSSLGARREIYEYPFEAIREAVINAVTHRDYYYDSSHTYVHMYPDRIEIENPGGLFHGLSLEKLGHLSVRRNRLIADMLHRAKYIERVGSGFDRMQHALKENNNPPYEISATNFFGIRFYKRIAEVDVLQLTPRQHRLYELIKQQKIITKKQAAQIFNVSDDTVLRDLSRLIELQLIQKQGSGRAISYCII